MEYITENQSQVFKKNISETINVINVYEETKPTQKIKNHTHVTKVGPPQNFCLTFADELEKQLFI